MEEVLDLYQSREDPVCPVVCVDEKSKQHIKDTRQRLPGIIGSPCRFDYEYARNGVSNLFMIFAPLLGSDMSKSPINSRALIVPISVEI